MAPILAGGRRTASRSGRWLAQIIEPLKILPHHIVAAGKLAGGYLTFLLYHRMLVPLKRNLMTLHLALKPLDFSAKDELTEEVAENVGFRFGRKGTHTSRTLMLDELTSTLASAHSQARRADYASAIIDENCLGKPTTATRRLSNQRLGELYALDSDVPLFRVLRRVWEVDAGARPLLALLVAVARDPLLAGSANAIIPLEVGTEYDRDAMRRALREVAGDRLNDSTLDKVARNAASSWTQSGHLHGRTFKRRIAVKATPASVAFALYMGYAVGGRGEALFSGGWIGLLDCTPLLARSLALEAKRHGLIDLRMAGDVIALDVGPLDPRNQRR